MTRRVSDRLEFVNRSCGQKKCKQYNPEMHVMKIHSGETQSLDKTPTVSADYSMHHSTLICTVQNVYTVQTSNFVKSSGQSVVIQCAIVYSERCRTVYAVCAVYAVYAVYAVPLAVCSLCRIAVDISQ